MPGLVVEVLVMGPVAEAARRWLSRTYDLDLAEAVRLLPDRIWGWPSPSTAGPSG
ncbi:MULTISPECIES: hypothetical protein [unclassified Streptomyces]|uniref:hypothetical protein n=1 Tax=unclassified Streptomyces TaxID=2593676 RepID=UPI003825F4C5